MKIQSHCLIAAAIIPFAVAQIRGLNPALRSLEIVETDGDDTLDLEWGEDTDRVLQSNETSAAMDYYGYEATAKSSKKSKKAKSAKSAKSKKDKSSKKSGEKLSKSSSPKSKKSKTSKSDKSKLAKSSKK
jgi:hypothetical protein